MVRGAAEMVGAVVENGDGAGNRAGVENGDGDEGERLFVLRDGRVEERVETEAVVGWLALWLAGRKVSKESLEDPPSLKSQAAVHYGPE